MTEAQFWQKFRKGVPHDAFCRRIEDSSGNLGTFDTFIAWRGASGWIELKVAGPNARPSLRPGQPAFASDCTAAGVPAAYLVGSKNGSVRLLGPGLSFDNWRDHVIASWPSVDVTSILDVFFREVINAR